MNNNSISKADLLKTIHALPGSSFSKYSGKADVHKENEAAAKAASSQETEINCQL